jgi:Zn-dependent metalloprotease
MNVASIRAAAPAKLTHDVVTYDATDPKKPRRQGDDKPSGDKVLDTTHDNVRTSLDFYNEVLGRNSVDGKGGRVKVYVNDEEFLANAAWYDNEIHSGSPDGEIFTKSPGVALDVIAHELAHGVIENEANLVYSKQPGALNESFADVFGEAAEQWHENRSKFGTPAGAKAADWLIGEDAMNHGFAKAIRDMRDPGSMPDEFAQPGHMDDYVKMTDDNGGVHINSGIPNRAAFEAAQVIGTEKVAKVWYHALTEHLQASATFSEAAKATVKSADQLYGEPVTSAVADAWEAVGVLKR